MPILSSRSSHDAISPISAPMKNIYNSNHPHPSVVSPATTHLKSSSSTSSITTNGFDFPTHNSARWGVLHSVVNLPAALNDPTYRQTDIFSRTWGDQFERAEVLPSPHLPPIEEKLFEPYLQKLGSRATAPGSVKRSPQQNLLLQAVRGSSTSRDFPVSASVISQHGPAPLRSISLETVPAMLFDADFSLQQLRTFTQLIPLHPRRLVESGVTFDPTRCDLSSEEHSVSREDQLNDFRAQHDRLAHYLDIVEVHLAEQVSRKSSIFFEAVCCHDIVREQLVQALTQVKAARAKLSRLDKSFTVGVMRLHRLIRRKANYELLLQRLKMIASLQSAQPTIQLLLRTSDFCAALDLVASTQQLLHSSPGEQSSGQQQPLVCLRHLSAQLTEISRFVRHMIEAEFEAALRQFLEIHAEEDHYTGPDLVSCLLGLLHTRRHDFVSAFRAELATQFKRVQTLPVPGLENGASDATGNPESILSKDQVRTMPIDSWLKLCASRCDTLRSLLRRTEKAKSIFLETLGRCDRGSTEDNHTFHESTTLSTELVEDLTAQLEAALRFATETAQKIVQDLVLTRMKQPTSVGTDPSEESLVEKLTMEEFVQLLQMLDDFVTFTAKLCNTTISDNTSRPPPILRLIAALVRFKIARMHLDRVSKLELMLNQERWLAVPVPKPMQQLVNGTFAVQLRQGCKPEFTSSRCSTVMGDSSQLLQFRPSDTAVSKAAGVSSSLVFGSEHFVVVGTALLLLPILLDYVHLAELLPGKPYSTEEVATRLAELLKSFNSRTCQLVLGAEARRSADLPTISARNLALASRSLQLIAQFIPIIQGRFDSWGFPSGPGTNPPSSDSLPSSNRRKPLQYVTDLLKEHVGQIHDKLFNLLSNRIQDRLSVWQVRPPTPSTELRTICHALIRMSSMTKDVLPTDQLTQIFLRAHNEFKAHMCHRLRELSVVADGGPQQSLVDAELAFYSSQFKQLTPELSDFQDEFADIWPS